MVKAHERFHVEETTCQFDDIMKSETSERIGAKHLFLYSDLNLSFVKELSNYKSKTASNFDYNHNRFRASVYVWQAMRRGR